MTTTVALAAEFEDDSRPERFTINRADITVHPCADCVTLGDAVIAASVTRGAAFEAAERAYLAHYYSHTRVVIITPDDRGSAT